MIKSLTKLFTSACLLLPTLIFSQPVFAGSGVSIENAWIAEAPPVSKVLAAYMEFKNNNNQAVSIVSAESESFERTEFHQTQYKNDMAKMQKQDNLTIPANSRLEFEPGGHHIMLFNPLKKLKAGDKVNFLFKLDNGESIETLATVKRQNMNHSHDHH